MQRIPVSDADELKKLAEKALAQLKGWLQLAQQQLQSLGIDSVDDYYGLPFVWFQKVSKRFFFANLNLFLKFERFFMPKYN